MLSEAFHCRLLFHKNRAGRIRITTQSKSDGPYSTNNSTMDETVWAASESPSATAVRSCAARLSATTVCSSCKESCTLEKATRVSSPRCSASRRSISARSRAICLCTSTSSMNLLDGCFLQTMEAAPCIQQTGLEIGSLLGHFVGCLLFTVDMT